MAVSDNMTATLEEARKVVLKCVKKQRPAFLWGPPGIGKSDLVTQLAEEMGGAVFDIRMSQMEPTDIRGIPYFNKVTLKMDWAEPVDLPSKEAAEQYPIVFLFLDEMNSAPPSVQAAAYQLVWNRRVGTYKLPDNVVIIAAGNRDSDKGRTYHMPTPLANRFTHVEVRHDFTSFFNYAIKNKLHKDIVGYLSFAKNDMFTFDPKSSSHAFATPRSWFICHDYLEDDIDEDTLRLLLAGTVGDGIAVKFMAHRRHAADMPLPEDILSGKVTKLKTKEISAMYSLVTSLCYELKDFHDKNKDNKDGVKDLHKMFDNYLSFMMENFETELNVMGGRVAMRNYKIEIDYTKLKNFQEFREKYGKYVFATNLEK